MSHLAHNYDPLPVDLARADGAWAWDAGGKRYLDLLAGYSALNFGHRHPALVAAAHRQLDTLTLTSRAFGHVLLEPWADRLAALTGTSMVLPMNTGAEAVETAIKTARKWGYDVKGVPDGEATIVVGAGNFHGRTTTIVSFSTDDDARRGFSPYTPGFRVVPYGDAAAVEDAIDDTTVAVLLEPIQGEQGVVVPPEGFWPRVRAACDANDVLLVADEIQSGLGRTGTTLALDLWGVRADLTTLGKALGGGVVPISAVVGRADVLGVLTPGTHGSTFGGNPLACAVSLAVLDLLETGEYQERAKTLGEVLHDALGELVADGLLAASRGVGLWAGLDVPVGAMPDDAGAGDAAPGRVLCEALLARGVLAKEAHGRTVRLAPPLVVEEDDLRWGLTQLRAALTPPR
ncbi:ornithine--oxo-acid transaminase [Luteimicrobium sp. NPDC057192]|uniref:ornithine--oxo-acid transaminase n=1 Tax=Luteimicrobium sp. NPDC057192 TaxID=3346042 RepID=UPI0036341089